MPSSVIQPQQVVRLLPDHMGQGVGDLLMQLIGPARVIRVLPRREELGGQDLNRSSLLGDVVVRTPHPIAQRFNLTQHCGIGARQFVAAEQGFQFINCQQHVFEVSRVH